MASGPIFTYDAHIINPGVDLTLTGQGTPNLTATYGDYGGHGTDQPGVKATCTISINYSNIAYTINNDNSITVTGEITGAILTRTYVRTSQDSQEITSWFNDQQTFHTVVGTSQAGTWDLNIPNTFSVTIPPSNNPQFQWPASIHYKNRNTNNPDPSPQYPPDEFYFGLGIKNPNPPDYRPGEDRQNSWKSHNRSGGKANILVNGTWTEMRTNDGGAGTGNPPYIRTNGNWINQRKIGEE